MNARAYRRKGVQRSMSATKYQNAFDAIGELEPGCETFILTFGQFSLIDAIAALVRKTGPASVVISTWTAGHTDLTTTALLLEDAEITDLRLIVDRSFLTRQPGYCRRMLELFGPDCIRTWRGHAKFAIIRNAKWSLVVRTSMNLNTNPRLENLEISDDPDFCDFFLQIVDTHFAEQAAGELVGELPELNTVGFDDKPTITTGRMRSAPMPKSQRRAG